MRINDEMDAAGFGVAPFNLPRALGVAALREDTRATQSHQLLLSPLLFPTARPFFYLPNTLECNRLKTFRVTEEDLWRRQI